MRIVWSSTGWADLDRLHAFLAEQDPNAADAVFGRLANAPAALLNFPRRGSRLSEFNPRQVREYRVGNYLLRYELTDTEIFVLRFFHSKKTVSNTRSFGWRNRRPARRVLASRALSAR